MTADDKGQDIIDGVPARTLDDILHSLGIFLSSISHTPLRPVMQGIADGLARDFAFGKIEVLSPGQELLVAQFILLRIFPVLSHLKVRVTHRDGCRAEQFSTQETGL